jgi:hypothetical protein
MRIGQQPEQLWPSQFGTALIFAIPSGDLHSALGGECLDLTTRASCILLLGRGPKIGANKAHLETLRFTKLVS